MVKRSNPPTLNLDVQRIGDGAHASLGAAGDTRPQPIIADPGWSPEHTTVGVARDEHERMLIRRLRFRVYIHEQGRRLRGVDWSRAELPDALDPCSHLWCARDGDEIVGTLTQTVIGPTFDLSRLPTVLELHRFPRMAGRPLGFSSRFVVMPHYRGTWVLPSLVRRSYAHGRQLGGIFDFMVTNPGLVPFFEALGYVRYTSTAHHQANGVGLLIPMVLAATDLEHLQKVRSACLPAAASFEADSQWGAWLRTEHPIMRHYYDDSAEQQLERAAVVAERLRLPRSIALELLKLGFVHHFPAGAVLRLPGDRVTSGFVALDGDLSLRLGNAAPDLARRIAPDGVPFSRAGVSCETDAFVLCVPARSLVRRARRYPSHAARLHRLMENGI